MRGFSVEKARMVDVPDIADLLGDLFAIETDYKVDAKRQERGLRMILDAPERGTVILARDCDGRIMGMLTVQLLVSTASGGLSGVIEDLVVRDNVRSAGVGSRLLEEGVAWGVNMGAERFQLAVDQRNDRAERFYLWKGFEKSHMTLFYASFEKGIFQNGKGF